MRRGQNSPGFTLLELVLVIGILALLMGILFGVLGPARGMSRVAVCTSNLRQIGMAYKMYLADHGHYPEPLELTKSSYLKDRRILVCPADTSIVLQGAASSYILRHYVPPDFAPLWETANLDPDTVLADCEHHLRQRVISHGNDVTTRTPAGFPYRLVLRADGRVDRVHLSRIRTFRVPGDRPMFMNAYPGEPGYEKALPEGGD